MILLIKYYLHFIISNSFNIITTLLWAVPFDLTVLLIVFYVRALDYLQFF
jgi:cytochrome c-type biogenesis protein CcmH/NrfF